MTCVLGMVVQREREIRNFVKTPYYKIIGNFGDEEKIYLQSGKFKKNLNFLNLINYIMNLGLKKKRMRKN